MNTLNDFITKIISFVFIINYLLKNRFKYCQINKVNISLLDAQSVTTLISLLHDIYVSKHV